MNAEYLLDAIGHLDDDLIREAERYRRPRVRYGLLLTWAASFAVAILLSYGVTHIGMGGSAAPSNGGAAPSVGGYSGAGPFNTPAGGRPDGAAGQDAPPEATPSSPGGDWFTDANGTGPEAPDKPGAGESTTSPSSGKQLRISLRRDGAADRHTFFLRGGEDRILDELPEGCVELGRLALLGVTEEADVPYINSEEFAGCPVWLLMEDPETAVLFVGLPGDGYLEFR